MELNLVGIVIFVTSLCAFTNGQICRDKYKRFPNHTMCLTWSNKRQDTQTADEILDRHNAIRANVVPAAANMLQLEHFKTLAIEAQIWSEQCRFTHDSFHLRFQPARYDVGQNMFISKTNVTWATVIDHWHQENMTFKYGNPNNNISEVGNYSQIVHADTRAVGCGMSNCNGTFFYVCNYSPRLEPEDLSTPYGVSSSGMSCDSCRSHCNTNDTSTLCSCEGKFCQNGGQLNLTTCECKCVEGVKSYNASLYCRLRCDPNGDHSSCDNYAASDCLTNRTVIFMCPWKCGICPWGGSNYKGGVPFPSGCPIPGRIANGVVSYSGVEDGDVATYTCLCGYTLSKVNDTRVCNNEKWSGNEPTCQSPPSCPDPGPITHGNVSVTTYSGVKLAFYSCDIGYYIDTGNQTRVCENGQWNGVEPACLGLPTNTNGNLTGTQTAQSLGCNRNDAGMLFGSVYSIVSVCAVYLFM